MAYIASVGLGIPKNEITQQEAKTLVQRLFKNNRHLKKLLSVFDNAMVYKRQLAKDITWYENKHTFKKKNATYVNCAKDLSLEAIDHCLNDSLLADSAIGYETIDAIIFVSSSGIATPTLDAHLINERNFREDVVRIPLWGLGCAGGAMGLSRGFEWLKAHPDKTVLVVACDLCSMTFQQEDDSMSNIVATALFGDGAAAALLIGENSPQRHAVNKPAPVIRETSSQTTKNTLDVMGWDLTDEGLDVIFSKNIPKLVPDIWKRHVLHFLGQQNMDVGEISTFLAHPGGRKVLEAMQHTFDLNQELLSESYEVLGDHGNMSSATILYVIKKWLDIDQKHNKGIEHALLCALGPGFSSELLLVERDGR